MASSAVRSNRQYSSVERDTSYSWRELENMVYGHRNMRFGTHQFSMGISTCQCPEPSCRARQFGIELLSEAPNFIFRDDSGSVGTKSHNLCHTVLNLNFVHTQLDA
jgi:hypothetical protein